MSTRINIREILADPVKRKRLMVHVLIATQAREGRYLTYEEASAVYDRVRAETAAGRVRHGRHRQEPTPPGKARRV